MKLLILFNFILAVSYQTLATNNSLNNKKEEVKQTNSNYVEDCKYINKGLLKQNIYFGCCGYLDGIICKDGRIIEINLENKNLNSFIPESIGKLTELTKLSVYNNNLSGSLPESILNLKKLTYLNLYNNKLTGPIPPFDSSFIFQYFDISKNRFTEPIPTSLTNVTFTGDRIFYYNCFPCSDIIDINKKAYCPDDSLSQNKCKLKCKIMQDYLKIDNSKVGVNFICNDKDGQIKELTIKDIALTEENLSFIFAQPNLVTLTLINNEIDNEIFPSALTLPENLESLVINDNKLTEVPDWIITDKDDMICDIDINLSSNCIPCNRIQNNNKNNIIICEDDNINDKKCMDRYGVIEKYNELPLCQREDDYQYRKKCSVNEIFNINSKRNENLIAEDDSCQKCFKNVNSSNSFCRKCPSKEIFKDIKILSPLDTLNEIIYNNKSISRFGDGEIKLIYGVGIRFQKPSKELSVRLKEVLESQLNGLLVGINNSLKRDYLNLFDERGRDFWGRWAENNKVKISKLLNNDVNYGSSLISRFYLEYQDKSGVSEFVKVLKKVWDGKDILIVEGKKSRLGVGNDLFDNTKSIQRILCPVTNAFDIYDKIYDEILKYGKNKLILLALGPTATVLAYDLYNDGYQALDIGHVDIEYEWYLKKARSKVQIKNKFVNEVNKGKNKVDENIKDESYNSQIISEIM